mgnify:CR=1 FL=1
MPQIGSTTATLYIPVETPEEGKKVMDILGCYDLFQLENNIKPDYANANGLQVYDEESGEWEDWYSEDGEELETHLENNEELQTFSKELFGQLKK